MNARHEVVVKRQFIVGLQSASLRIGIGPLLVLSLCMALFLWAPAVSHGQVSTGDILGNVSDAGGAALPGAELVLTNTQTQERHTVQSDASGQYVFTLLLPGHYSLQVKADGFSTYKVNDIPLAGGDRRRLLVTLTLSSVSQTVVVSGAPPALDTDTSTMSTAVSQMQVQDLPLNGRNFVLLADMAAGANEGSPAALASGTRPDDRRQASSVVANAQTDAQNNEMIEGVDNNEGTIGSIGVRPSVDAIAEFRVQTSLYPAEVGKTPGAVVNIITRGGTNELHGSVYEFLRNDIVDARSFFARTGNKPEYRQNQFGGSLGGPVRRDKAFFFADYEGLRYVQGNTTVNTVPTAYQVAHPGDFTDVGGPNVSASIVAPGLNFFKMYPSPNSGTNTYTYSPNTTYYSTTVDGRGDYRFNDNNLLFARFSYNNVAILTPSGLPAVTFTGIGPIDPGGSVSYPGKANDVADQLILNYVHVFSPKTSLELKAGYTYIKNISHPLNEGTNAGNALGITNSNFNQFTSALPSFTISGYAPLGDSASLPLYDGDNIYQYGGSLTRVQGSHTLKYGAVLIRRQIYNEQPSSGDGAFGFTTSPNSTSTTATNIVPLINLLLGLPYTTSRSMQFSPRYPRTWEPSFYAQDDWRATSKLTLNLGIRYDLLTADKFLGNNISQFDPVSAKILVAGVNSSETAGINTDHRSLAPRVGFAANLRPGTVVRGGYGIVFFRDNTGPSVPFANAPYVTTYAPTNGSVTNLTSLPLPVQGSYTNPSGALRGMDLNYRNSYIEQGSLNVQQEYRTFVLTLAYVGEWGHKLRTSPDRNLALPSTVTTPAYTTRRPFYNQYPNVTSVYHIESNGFSNFHSLQGTVEKNMGGGLYLNANYTWEKAMGDIQGFSAGGLFTSAVPSQMSTLEYGLSEQDVQNRFAMMLNYKIPFGNKYTGVKALLAKGWQFNAIDVWQTGMPFTVNNATPRTNTGVSADRPDQTGNPQLAHPSYLAWFNTAAFTGQTTGTIGSTRR
ncbi:MAG: carboxypeptidase regulatory-like domain-containing protein, partial [Acidobacteriaceae bacterium]|nr:carboxypeptidase regulatory-like domain-containing protein [Acidobacteriaceae bacterium]